MDTDPRRLVLAAAVVALLIAASIGLAFALPLDATDRTTPFETTAGTDATAPYTETAAVHIGGVDFFDYSYATTADGAEHLVLEVDGGDHYEERYSPANSSVTHARISVVDAEEADRLATDSDGEVVDRYQADGRHVVVVEGKEISPPAEVADAWRHIVWSTAFRTDYEPVGVTDGFDVYEARDAWHLSDSPGRDVRLSRTNGEIVVDDDGQLHGADVSYRVTPAKSYAHYHLNRNDGEPVTVAYDFDTEDVEIGAPDWVDE